MEINNLSIIFGIFGFLIIFPASRYLIMSFVAFCLVYSKMKSSLKIEENQEPKGFKETFEKEKRINNNILDVWKKVMAQWTPDEINKTNYSKLIVVFGAILIVIGLIMQFNF